MIDKSSVTSEDVSPDSFINIKLFLPADIAGEVQNGRQTEEPGSDHDDWIIFIISWFSLPVDIVVLVRFDTLIWGCCCRPDGELLEVFINYHNFDSDLLLDSPGDLAALLWGNVPTLLSLHLPGYSGALRPGHRPTGSSGRGAVGVHSTGRTQGVVQPVGGNGAVTDLVIHGGALLSK